jgi:hypothetical protein
MLPQSVDVAEAMALMPDDDAAGDDAAAAAAEAQSQPEPEAAEPEAAEPEEEGPPAFWSAEDKAAWARVPAELRPVLRKYEQQRVEFVNARAREAAELREVARAEVERHAAVVDDAARWWAEATPALQRAFADKWAEVNWRELAEKNPNEWARLNQQRMDEAALLAEANRRGEADRQLSEARAEAQAVEARRGEHAKLAERLPDWFGTPERAHRTYDAIGRFLFEKGIPAERINAVYEAPIVELALNAWRFEQAQQHAQRRGTRGREALPAHPAPTRVAPGPASSAMGMAGNRGGEAARQAGERFRRTGDVGDAARLIEQLGI